MKQAAEKDTWTNYFDLEFRGEGTIKGVRDWLDMLEVISKELGSEPEIVTDYDSTLSAEWTWEVPFTAEEKQKAKEWLEANPAPEPTTIKWHKPVPFGEAEPF